MFLTVPVNGMSYAMPCTKRVGHNKAPFKRKSDKPHGFRAAEDTQRRIEP